MQKIFMALLFMEVFVLPTKVWSSINAQSTTFCSLDLSNKVQIIEHLAKVKLRVVGLSTNQIDLDVFNLYLKPQLKKYGHSFNLSEDELSHLVNERYQELLKMGALLKEAP